MWELMEINMDEMNCPECDGHVHYDKNSGKYYCPKCDRHWDSSEVEPKEAIDHIFRDH